MNKEVLRKTISVFLSFASSLLFAVALAALAAVLAFSKPFVTAVLSSPQYMQKAKAEILEDFESYAIPGGLPADFFEQGFDDELLRKNINHAIDCAYSGKEFAVLEFGKQAKADILAYAAEHEVHSATAIEMESSIDQLVAYCESSYRTFTYSLILKYIGIAGRTLLRIALLAGAAMLILSVLLLSIVCRMNPQNKRFYFRSVLCGSAIMLAALPLYVLLSRGVANLGISSASLYLLASSVIYSLLFLLIFMSVILIIIAVIKLPFRKKRQLYLLLFCFAFLAFTGNCAPYGIGLR